MASTVLQGQTVAFLVAQEGVEEVELTERWKAVLGLFDQTCRSSRGAG